MYITLARHVTSVYPHDLQQREGYVVLEQNHTAKKNYEMACYSSEPKPALLHISAENRKLGQVVYNLDIHCDHGEIFE